MEKCFTIIGEMWGCEGRGGVVRVGMIVWETGVDVERSLLENYRLKVFHRNLSCLRRFFSHSFFTAISFPITDPKSFLKSTKNSFIVTVLSAPIYFEKKSHKRVWNKSKKCDRLNQDRKIVFSLLMSLESDIKWYFIKGTIKADTRHKLAFVKLWTSKRKCDNSH